ncbi:protein-L-isoaspartate O-methyltransferase [Hygrophoropsis aurantiaca]|uniref:Protein-L-isoaspartate O-methyltransferase n=1 Tax=Hygrophoropsis aurantiaca TaxID=72124 RepID=A0ACB8A7F3_9AGAM|nr:protein-L-isoaspartate O-methyltransferase [Hygrophoropsis aurantiaca]
MAWRCTGRTNTELIANMAQHGIINAERVTTAMAKVDRANYVLSKEAAYQDSPQRIGHGATISAPHMHAHAMEHLLPFLFPGAKVLDVGSGSGYLCAVLHHLVSFNGEAGKVVGIDHIPELVNWSVTNLKKDGLGEALQDKRIEMISGDGRQGYAAGGPYDAIHVGAAAPALPQALVDQLASPGRMFIPVGTVSQQILQVDKDAHGKVTGKELMGVIYVPLTDAETQKRGYY